MSIRFHNTLTRKKELFTPMNPDQVTMYVCGPTVYNRVHIGNGRPAVVFDTLFRLLQLHFKDVIYARNITDIDDKINNAAAEQGVPISVISEKFTLAYQEDMDALHVLEPSIQPKATEHIDDIIRIIAKLIENGHAYERDGHVLFNVPSMAGYGTLSNRNIDDMLAGARVEIADYKKDPMDFVLWKPSTGGLPGWESPWGFGRPGWHIECTAMINKHFGPTIDIHAGGNDLVFPHHENERAQGMCSHDEHTDYVHYWLHNGMININGEKMSKSLNNFITIKELLDQYSGEQLRYALLSGHYRSVLNFSDDLITQSKMALNRFYTALKDTADVVATPLEDPRAGIVALALADDLNTPEALAAMHGLAGQLFKATDDTERARLKGEFLAGGALLGFFHHEPNAWFAIGADMTLSDADIEQKVSERTQAKKDKDFVLSDKIRQELLDLGVEIQDTREGTQWHRTS